MIAMRYAITLPRDYDMGRIRHRVATRGSALDDYEGLVFKAYCLREAGVDGATSNEYAPFYVWANTSRMARFLWGGDGFQGIEADFGRPVVETWPVASLHVNGAGAASATVGVFSRALSNAGDSLADTAGRLKTDANAAVLRKDCRAAVRAIDLATGDQVGFDLLAGQPRRTDGTVYEVAHVSVPSRA
ncbi:DUF4865 family protein [Demequina litorisediminis]|uniref:DUF4865 domain-containing protein n=1 Tax=Demequina litorisediminis TaxID=1849022 RepID=A0ABQ6II82_9MICO|nr:DUF4865 family protein [Demequina litorisediminis]GMA37520.1 DUF4865 domain-containing protein [Demequina litorisediminis]